MKLIKPSFEIIEQQSGYDGMLKQIELAGRTAYKSEDKITDDSAVKFVKMLEGVSHGSVLEHGTVYLKIKWYSLFTLLFFFLNKYSKIKKWRYVTTNYRVIVENNKSNVLKYQCDPTESHEKRATVKFVCDRGVSHEFVRHRVMSITQESTRYCNYSKDKFGNELTFITPEWLLDCDVDAINKGDWGNCDEDSKYYANSLKTSEDTYLFLLNCPNKWKPQQARSVLPNSLKTEIVMTGFISDWKHFFKLRTAPQAHPQAIELAKPLEVEFKKLSFI